MWKKYRQFQKLDNLININILSDWLLLPTQLYKVQWESLNERVQIFHRRKVNALHPYYSVKWDNIGGFRFSYIYCCTWAESEKFINF